MSNGYPERRAGVATVPGHRLLLRLLDGLEFTGSLRQSHLNRSVVFADAILAAARHRVDCCAVGVWGLIVSFATRIGGEHRH